MVLTAATFFISAIALYMAFGLLICLMQAKLVFMPGRGCPCDPSHIGLAFEDCIFKSADGTELRGWFVPAQNPVCTILFCHGNAGCISNYLDTVEAFNSIGCDLFIFNYRGYGTSQYTAPTEEGVCMDAEAAWNYLTEGRGIPEGNILLVGRSLGAAVATELAVRRRPRAIVLESPFLSIPHMAAKLYPIYPSRFLARIKFDNLSKIPSVDCPTLIVHSPEDEIVPFSHGQALFRASGSSSKSFLTLAGPHNDCYFVSGDSYTDGLRTFVNSAFGDNREGRAQ